MAAPAAPAQFNTLQILNNNVPNSKNFSALAGKYLTVALGQESYGIAVIKVREIIRHTQITSVPQMSAFVQGVKNLRGRVIPVLDL